MHDSKTKPRLEECETARGFTLIEVLISMLITLIVMASVFALLTRGQKAFEREPEIADMQQSARAALDIVSKDVLQAGAGLLPEFPAFSRQNGGGDGAPTDVLVIVGAFQLPGEVYNDPEVVDKLGDGTIVAGCPSFCAQLTGATSNFQQGDVLVLYNDARNDGAVQPQWTMVEVTSPPGLNVGENKAFVELDYATHAAYNSPTAAVPFATDAGFNAGVPMKITRVSVVRYFTQLDDPTKYNGPPPHLLMRDLDFQGPQPVGYLDDFQIRYTIGVTAPVDQDTPPDPIADLGFGTPITADNMLAGVRISVTARSVTAGMEGASEGASAGMEDDFIRKTFSTNVNPRNISSGLDARVMATP